MLTWLKARYSAAGRYGNRALIYSVVGLTGLGVEVCRFGLLRPFGVFLWSLIFLCGCLLFLFMKEP